MATTAGTHAVTAIHLADKDEKLTDIKITEVTEISAEQLDEQP